MIIYTIDYINEFSSNYNETLDINIINYLNSFINKKNIYISKNKSFNNKSYTENDEYYNKNKKNYNKNFKYNKINTIDTNFNNLDKCNNSDNYINDISYNNCKINFNINRNKEINSVNEYEKILNNTRKLFNKLSLNNYEKISQEFICFYNIIKKQYINDKNTLNKINNYIFDLLIYGNYLFINNYCKLFIILINNNEYFSVLLNNNINKLLYIYKNIYELDNEKFTYTKDLEKLKSFTLFYCLCFNEHILPSDLLIKTINNIQNEIFNNLDNMTNKFYNELYSEFILIIIKSCYTLLKNSNNLEEYNKILENINIIINYKKNIPQGLNNKIIFKHMDIYEKFHV